MDAEHPARVAARGAGLAAEVRRERRIPKRQLLGVEDLAHVQPRERDLGRPGQVEAVLADLVVLVLLGREEARPVHRLLADEDGRQDRREARGDGAVERPAIEGERQERGVADEVPEPGPRHPSSALHLETAELEVLCRRGQLRPVADDALDRPLRVFLLFVGNRLVRWVRHFLQQLVPRRLGGRELLLELSQLLLDLLQLLDLLRRRLPLDLLPAAKLVDLRDEVAPDGVRLQQPVECFACALSRHRGPEGVRVGPRSLEVDQLAGCRKATRSASSCWLSCEP